MKFMLGCNYWDGAHGTDMWRDFDPAFIEEDIKALSAIGVKYMRVFPNWRDFQPVRKLYGCRGANHGYATVPDEKELPDVNGIDPRQIENFKVFAAICKKYDIKLLVSVVTGWMSGRLFVPEALQGKNPINDPEVLLWTNRFIKGFVSGVKDCDNIVMWELGNESNCMGFAGSIEEAYVWTAFVRNAISAADPTRPVSSGMHSLDSTGKKLWQIPHQGEITDVMTTHPYVSKTINNDIEPMNRLRTTLMPTLQCIFYSDLGGKPVLLEEQGGFSEALGHEEMDADFARINIWSALAHNVMGYMWWCGPNHNDLDKAPYTWSMIERDLGLMRCDRSPKPVGLAIKECSERLEKLPFDTLPPYQRQALCLLTSSQEHWDCAAPAMLLAKQAGVDSSVTMADHALPEAQLYLMPCVTGWDVLHQHALNSMLQNVRKGATLYISYDGANMSIFEEITGMRSHGIVKSRTRHRATFDFGSFDYSCTQELLLENIEAEVLAKNEEGNIVFARHALGKGQVYFLNMPLEKNLADEYNGYDKGYHRIYGYFTAPLVAQHPLSCADPDIVLTLHKKEDGSFIAAVLNYSDREKTPHLQVKEGWTLSPIDNQSGTIRKCDAAFYEVKKS